MKNFLTFNEKIIEEVNKLENANKQKIDQLKFYLVKLNDIVYSNEMTNLDKFSYMKLYVNYEFNNIYKDKDGKVLEEDDYKKNATNYVKAKIIGLGVNEDQLDTLEKSHSMISKYCLYLICFCKLLLQMNKNINRGVKYSKL